jgi:hypothetical protein
MKLFRPKKDVFCVSKVVIDHNFSVPLYSTARFAFLASNLEQEAE